VLREEAVDAELCRQAPRVRKERPVADDEHRTWDVPHRHPDGCFLVSDADIRATIRTLAVEARVIAEPADAAGFAAWVRHRQELEPPIVAVISGGNVDPALLADVLGGKPLDDLPEGDRNAPVFPEPRRTLSLREASACIKRKIEYVPLPAALETHRVRRVRAPAFHYPGNPDLAREGVQPPNRRRGQEEVGLLHVHPAWSERQDSKRRGPSGDPLRSVQADSH